MRSAALEPCWSVRAFDEVDSTNTRIKEAIEQGAPEGTCFVARRQRAAYGRQGRAWSSPEGGLYFSFILDPLGMHADAAKTLADLPALSLLLSLAVRSALAALTNSDQIKIKWPNDILIVQDDKVAKLCGISLEVVDGKLCCGIGINVTRPDTERSNELSSGNTPAYLSDLTQEGIVLDQVLSAVLNKIAVLYQDWFRSGMMPLIPSYESHLYNMGQEVNLESITGSTLYAGEVAGVTESGELILKASDGTFITATSGEVHTRH